MALMNKGVTPGELAHAFRDLDIQNQLTRTLETQAQRLKAAIQANLERVRGDPHDTPWRETGALLASISSNVDGLVAVVGTNDPAAAPQEFGTAHLPPRPFLLPVITTMSEPIASEIAAALLECIAGALT